MCVFVCEIATTNDTRRPRSNTKTKNKRICDYLVFPVDFQWFHNTINKLIVELKIKLIGNL